MTNLIKHLQLSTLVFLCFNLELLAKPFESTYEPLPPINLLIQNANIYDGEGNEFQQTDLLIQDRKIIAIGKDLPVSDSFQVIDATGKWITPVSYTHLTLPTILRV